MPYCSLELSVAGVSVASTLCSSYAEGVLECVLVRSSCQEVLYDITELKDSSRGQAKGTDTWKLSLASNS